MSEDQLRFEEAAKWPDYIEIVRWYGLTANAFSHMYRVVAIAGS